MHRSGQFRKFLPVVLLAVLVALAGCAGGGSGDSGAASTATGGASAGQGDAESGGDAGSGEDGGDRASYRRGDERVIVRSASMELEVDDFEDRFRKARRIARRHGGFVTDYDIQSDGEWQRATFVVRVPARNFTAARDGLADLGRLESEQVRAEDFTDEHQRRKGKLARLRERERNLERRLNDESDADERERLRSELRDVRDRIDELEARQQALERREALSTIRVTMQEPEREKPPENYESSFGFGDSLLAGFYGGLWVLKGVVVAAGYLVSLGLGGLALGLVGMVFYGVGLAGTQRVWPRLRDLLGIEARSPAEVEPRSGETIRRTGDVDTGDDDQQ